MRKKFRLSHSVLGLLALLLLLALASQFSSAGIIAWLVLAVGLVGSGVTLYVATEVIEEVRNARHMLVLLSAVVAEFVLFFAVLYYYFLLAAPASFGELASTPVSLLLQSTMVFVFNPLYLPTTELGRTLLLINSVGSLGLVLFILQNIWQFRRAQ